jgi:hypothetical protein
MSKVIKQKNDGIVNLKVRFTNKPVTVMGGMKLIAEWMRKIEFEKQVKTLLKPLEPKSNRGYKPVKVILSFMVSMLMGAKKLSHSVLLENDEPAKKMFGLKEIPSVSTFSRFFRKIKRPIIEEVFPVLNGWLLESRKAEIPGDGITIDLDSSVFERYGEQEGAEVGYNPRRPGRPSHHPLFAMISDIKLLFHLWLRRGKTGSISGVKEFLEEVLGRLPSWIKIKVIRCDSGFFSGKFFDFVEERSLKYMVVVRTNKIIRGIVRNINIKDWKKIGEGIEIGETEYQARDWKKSRRLIIIRQNLEIRPDAQGKLFPDMPLYRYQIIVTNLVWAGQDIWNYYRQRASLENYIKEFKNDYSMDKYSFSKFYATEAAIWLIAITWNLLGWFKKSILGKDNIRLMTVRLRYFLCGGILGNEKGEPVLRLHSGVKWRQTFLRLLNRVFLFQVPNAMQLNFIDGKGV